MRGSTSVRAPSNGLVSTPSRLQDVAREVNLFLTLIANAMSKGFERFILLLLRKLYDHRQVYAGYHLDRLSQKSRGDVCRCAAKHVGEQKHSASRVDALNRLLDFAARHVHVVVPPDRDRGDVVDFADDHLRGRDKLVRQLSVSDDHRSDHLLYRCSSLSMSRWTTRG